MNDKLGFNLANYQVLTDSGFRPFGGIAQMNPSIETIKFYFSDQTSVEVSHNHKFITNIEVINKQPVGIEVHAQALSIGDLISTMSGDVEIIDITPGATQATYDLIDVDDHKYVTNGVVSHNCQFISSDPLLIDTITLQGLQDNTATPLYEDMGYKFYKHIRPDRTYIIGVDPATGVGTDHTSIMVYDFDDMTLIAEFRSNTTSSPSAYATLKWILQKITDIKSNAYFSVENNGVGEGIIALYENDEKIPEGCDFISEEGGNRLGMRTESRVKLRTCLIFKQMVENRTLDCGSEVLVKEMQSFISHRGSYSAQIGATDDVISACLIVIRILQEMATYDQKAFNAVHTYQDAKAPNQPDDFSTLNKGTGGGGDGDNDDEYDDDYQPDGMIM